MHLSRLPLVLVAALGLSSAGCLTFDKQTFVITFNADKDEVQALFVYEGLQVAGEDEKDLKNATKGLEAIFAQGDAIYLGHPMLAIELSEYKEQPGQKPNPKEKQERELLRKHITLGSSAFFLDKQGSLCGTQTLTIKQASKFVAGLNEIMNDQIGEETEKLLKDETKRNKIDLETLRLRQKAVKDKHAWLRYEPGRLSLTLVGSPKHFEELKQGLIDEAVLNGVKQIVMPKGPVPIPGEQPKNIDPQELIKTYIGKLHEMERVAAFLAQTPWSVDQRKDKLTVSLGIGNAQPLRFFSPYMPSKRGRTAPLVEHAKTLKVEMLKDTSAELLITEFLKKHEKK